MKNNLLFGNLVRSERELICKETYLTTLLNIINKHERKFVYGNRINDVYDTKWVEEDGIKRWVVNFNATNKEYKDILTEVLKTNKIVLDNMDRRNVEED